MGSKYSKREPKTYNIFRALFQKFVTTCGYALWYRFNCGYRVFGRENLPKDDEFYIVASNHVSAVDPFLMCHAVNKPLAYMAKKELFEGFWQALFMDFMGAFEVDREKLQVSTIKTALGIKKTKWKLALFPQGTRNPDNDMTNVTKGFAGLAKSLKCPILPVGIIGASKQDRHTRGVKMYFNIGKPIPYSNDTENMVKIWTSEIEELTNLEKLEKKINKNKKNYARKYAKDFNIWTRLYQYWAMIVIFWPVHMFYKIKWQGRKHLDKKKQYLLAPNHISYLDPILNCGCTGRGAAYMAKKELFENSKWLAKNIDRLGAFAVDRGHLEPATIKTAFDVYKAGWDLCLYPQGGIRKNKKIENINAGFVMIAKKMKVDIVPISITGVEKYNWNPFKRALIEFKIGEPISYELDKDEIIRIWKEKVAEMAGYELGE